MGLEREGAGDSSLPRPHAKELSQSAVRPDLAASRQRTRVGGNVFCTHARNSASQSFGKLFTCPMLPRGLT